MIGFKDVTRIYDNMTALRKVTFGIEKGEFVYITGPSGAGKSTLLKLIYLAEKPDEGTISIAGWDTDTLRESSIPYLRRNIGVVFQDFKLLANRTVYDNIALALRIRGFGEAEIKGRVQDALKLVGLRHKNDNFPAALSGGEQQRITIARAIVGEPTVLLADEPTGNLDVDNAAGIMKIFKEINARGTTILIATHNRELFRNTGLRVLWFDSGNLVADEEG
ncbi:Cell-division-associated, ABC-transporter-like signaling protein FtsE [hydrothermal vent metagenome]|uniref:Cell division ATP-binding protein FtsE n=1 Tax=hydrothermal vent metagenome TaxID=652676 RepID=A0A3B1D9C3_9ZZZZ